MDSEAKFSGVEGGHIPLPTLPKGIQHFAPPQNVVYFCMFNNHFSWFGYGIIKPGKNISSFLHKKQAFVAVRCMVDYQNG